MTVLVDANILLYAKFKDYPQHEKAITWLDEALNASKPVGLPWQSLAAFMRIATNPKVFNDPMATDAAVAQVRLWCKRKVVWHPVPGSQFEEVYCRLLLNHHCTGNLVSDAYLAALALEHGLTVVSSDSDFARFPRVRWLNPIS
jgi:toxin-antitoxin system PIN domain toxin